MKYEYLTRHFSLTEADAELTKLGAEGWELVIMYDIPSGFVRVALKRTIGGDLLLGVE